MSDAEENRGILTSTAALAAGTVVARASGYIRHVQKAP